MNYNQSELFQYVLETMEANLHDKLNYHIEQRDYKNDNAQYCLDMLKRIARILESIDGVINRDDMNCVLDYLFGLSYKGERLDVEHGADYIDSVNATYGDICTDEEVEALIEELLIE